LPAGLHEKAVKYKIAFYESDQEIGKAASEGRTPRAFGRKWTDATGSFTVEAEFVESTGGTVRLKMRDGQMISLPLEKLSETDKKFVRAATQLQPTTKNPEVQVQRPAEATSYREVRKDITKYVGKRVAWVGKYVSSSSMSMTVNGKRSDCTTEYRYALVDKEGEPVLEDSFCFSHPGTKKDTKRTPAAQAADDNPRDKGIRLIRGTIAGSKTIQIPGSGNKWRSIEVPDLKDVVIAMPPKHKRQ
jgi:hypothetical protein